MKEAHRLRRRFSSVMQDLRNVEESIWKDPKPFEISLTSDQLKISLFYICPIYLSHLSAQCLYLVTISTAGVMASSTTSSLPSLCTQILTSCFALKRKKKKEKRKKKRQPGVATKCQDPSWDADDVSRLPLCCFSPELWRVLIRGTKYNREIKRRWVIDLWVFVIVRFTNNTNRFG